MTEISFFIEFLKRYFSQSIHLTFWFVHFLHLLYLFCGWNRNHATQVSLYIVHNFDRYSFGKLKRVSLSFVYISQNLRFASEFMLINLFANSIRNLICNIKPGVIKKNEFSNYWFSCSLFFWITDIKHKYNVTPPICVYVYKMFQYSFFCVFKKKKRYFKTSLKKSFFWMI